MQHPPVPTTLQTRTVWMAARLAYVLILMFATLMPYEASLDAALVLERLQRAFRPRLVGTDVVDGVRNVVLFAGWGLVWMLTRPAGSHRRGVVGALLSGLVLSAAAEGLQLFSANRNTSVLDLFTNTLGAGLGAVCTLWLVRQTAGMRRERSYLGLPMLLLAGPYLCAALAEAAFPLARSGIEQIVWGHPMARLRTVLAQAQWSFFDDFALVDVLLFIPAGFLAVAALVERGVNRRLAGAATLGGGLVVSVIGELAHGLVGYPITYTPVAAHTLGFALGAGAAVVALPALSRRLRGRVRSAAFQLAYLVVIVLWWWRPFLPESSLAALLEDVSLRRWIPVLAYGERVDFYSVADVVVSFFLYLPVGALLAVWPLRRSGWLRGAWPGVYAAFAIELGQAFIATRYFDVSDMFIPFAALAIGWAVIQRAGYTPHGELLRAPIPKPPRPTARAR